MYVEVSLQLDDKHCSEDLEYLTYISNSADVTTT